MKTSVAIVLFLVLAAGVVAANGIGGQTPVTSPTTTATPTGAPGTVSLATVQNIVEITRAVPAGPVAVDAFTVPAGVTLVVTDIVVTNTGTAAACGGAVNRAGGTPTLSPSPAVTPEPTAPTATTPPAVNTVPTTTTTPPPTTSPATGVTSPTAAVSATGATAATSLGTLTQTDSTVTGPLCVPAQTTTTLPLTTGIEFGSGQVVQLLNAPAATPLAAPVAPEAAPSSLAFHLRGMLITQS